MIEAITARVTDDSIVVGRFVRAWRGLLFTTHDERDPGRLASVRRGRDLPRHGPTLLTKSLDVVAATAEHVYGGLDAGRRKRGGRGCSHAGRWCQCPRGHVQRCVFVGVSGRRGRAGRSGRRRTSPAPKRSRRRARHVLLEGLPARGARGRWWRRATGALPRSIKVHKASTSAKRNSWVPGSTRTPVKPAVAEGGRELVGLAERGVPRAERELGHDVAQGLRTSR